LRAFLPDWVAKSARVTSHIAEKTTQATLGAICNDDNVVPRYQQFAGNVSCAKTMLEQSVMMIMWPRVANDSDKHKTIDKVVHLSLG
jgi:hypothetical protein